MFRLRRQLPVFISFVTPPGHAVLFLDMRPRRGEIVGPQEDSDELSFGLRFTCLYDALPPHGMTPMSVSVSISYTGRPTDQLTVTNSLRPRD
ncbi:hypothetical protein NDU88_005441 [Pleurodeles waltl]|uniref:Uncharacterized protein n=1 Tax=Pleurodeles waltl TaxID=8319 RepID=A0AAV7NMT1_PLEWA|nr:hypothetical protein NDU88_005441 [Pleurodeles waltl]